MTKEKILVCTIGIVLAMFALALSSAPLYDAFCRITGYGGTPRQASKAPDRILEREVTVRFDANVADAPIRFRPLQTSMDVRLGEHIIAAYEVTNSTSKPVKVIASYNVTPHEAGTFFSKMECFCFEERILSPNETSKLPVVFFVSPELDRDRIGKSIDTITLSYTFFNVQKTASIGMQSFDNLQ